MVAEIGKYPEDICVLSTAANLLAFGPTVRKSFLKPHEETLIAYVTAGVKWSFSIAALATVNATTVMYPLVMILANWSFAAFLIFRRKVDKKNAEHYVPT